MDVSEPHAQVHTEATVTLAARFERLPLTRYQKKLAAILATCFAIDAIDLSIMSFLLAPISKDLGLTTSAAGLAASGCFAGMGIGATIAGLVGDRFGRRRVLVSSMLLWGVATLFTAFAWNLESLVAFRFVTGLGLGAELPVAFALLAEFMPAARRARITSWMQMTSSVGHVVFNVLSLAAVALAGIALGWRAMFVVMFLFALFAMYVRRHLPESPRWYESRGMTARAEEAMQEIERQVEAAHGKPLPEPVRDAEVVARPSRHSPLRELITAGYIRRTMLAWALWLVVMLAYYGINTWVGKLLVDRGMSISKSILVGVLISFAGVPAAWLVGQTMDRVGRRAVLISSLALVAAAAFTYGHASSFGMVVLAGAAMQFALVSVATSLYAYTPELFPTRVRATAMGTASTAGRISAIAGPLAVPPIVLAWGYTGTFIVFAACFTFGAIMVLIFGPETKGRILEEVSK
jgi:putative MFS transporter